jgi:hypothetical protein
MAIFNFLKKKEFEEIELLKKELKKFDKITNVDIEINQKKQELEEYIIDKKKELELDLEAKSRELKRIEGLLNEVNVKYKSSLDLFEKITGEIKLFENKANQIEYGIYQPIYDFEHSENYLIQKEIIRASQVLLASSDKLNFTELYSDSMKISQQTSVNNSDIELIKSRIFSLMQLAFNTGAETIIAKARWNNINQLSKQIKKLYDQISDLGEGRLFTVHFNNEYEVLKQKELSLEHEYKLKKQKEKEEERANKELLREEEKARKEYEKAQKTAEIEELNYQKSISKIKSQIDKVEGEEHRLLLNQIAELELKLTEATLRKERAISMAQQTKRGHVYIISNLGAFGEDVFKIGMTRRLEPLDRVYELGNASVPFHFDIHAMIYSEDAPNLERELHKAFSSKKINMLNQRKEFFKVKIEDIESKLKKLGLNVNLNKNSDAVQFRETLAMLETLNSITDEQKDVYHNN